MSKLYIVVEHVKDEGEATAELWPNSEEPLMNLKMATSVATNMAKQYPGSQYSVVPTGKPVRSFVAKAKVEVREV